MDEPQVAQLSLPLTTLDELQSLLSIATQKLYELQSTGRIGTNPTSYISQLSDFKYAIASIHFRSSIVSRLGQDCISTIMDQANESGIMSQVASAVMSSMDVTKGQELVLSLVQTDAIRDGPGRDIDALLLAEATKLSREQQNIDLRFESFFSLCEDELLRRLNGRTATSPVEPDIVDNLTTFLSLIFHKSLFFMFSSHPDFQKCAPLLASINSCTSDDIPYTNVMINEAIRWVDDYTGELTSDDQLVSINHRYLQLLTGFKKLLDAEIKPLPPDCQAAVPSLPPTANGFSSWVQSQTRRWFNGSTLPLPAPSRGNPEETEAREAGQQADVLRSIHNLVTKEVDREATKKFSVALCGMVKSG